MDIGIALYIVTLFLENIGYLVVGIFVFNTLSLYLLNAIKYTKKFINFRFILGEFVGGFIAYIVGGYLYILIRGGVLDFDAVVFFVFFTFTLSFVLLVFNMLLLTIRDRVFEKNRYESLLSNESKKGMVKKSFIFGVCFSFSLNCIGVILFVMWLIWSGKVKIY